MFTIRYTPVKMINDNGTFSISGGLHGLNAIVVNTIEEALQVIKIRKGGILRAIHISLVKTQKRR